MYRKEDKKEQYYTLSRKYCPCCGVRLITDGRNFYCSNDYCKNFKVEDTKECFQESITVI